MRGLLGNLILALAWTALGGSLTLASLVSGFVLGFFVLSLGPTAAARHYVQRVRRFFALLGYFLLEMFVANLRVALAIVRPIRLMRVQVFPLPLDARSDIEITLLANLISLTPGTVALDVSPARDAILIHAINVDDVDAEIRRIKWRLERPLLQVLR